MPLRNYKNNLKTFLTSGGIDDSDTVILVANLEWGLAGAQSMMATLDQGGGVVEIVKITAVATTGPSMELTVVRGQEGTTAIAHPDNTLLEVRVTAAMFEALDPSGGLGISSVRQGEGAVVEASGVAIGYNAKAAREDDVNNVTAVRATATGYYSYAGADGASAYGDQARAFLRGEKAETAAPVMARDSGWYYADTAQPSHFLSASCVFHSPTVDLGPGVPWEPATSYRDNAVVVPTASPANKQFMLVRGYEDADLKYYNSNPAIYNSVTSSATEPTWVTTNIGDITPFDAGAAGVVNKWLYLDPSAGLVLKLAGIGSGATATIGAADRLRFFPTRVGFVCIEYAAMVAKPFISIGNEISTTAYVNNQELAAIGASQQMTWWDLTAPVGIQQIKWKIQTKGTTTGKCVGRFFVEGYFVQMLG